MTRDLDGMTLDGILARLKRLHPMMIDLSLGRLQALLAKLGHPERRLAPVIHIAGTNGKGSTTAYLKAMHEAAGKRVHVYTSPHLVRFNERIAVPDAEGIARPIPEDRLAELIPPLKERFDVLQLVPPSEAEMVALFRRKSDEWNISAPPDLIEFLVVKSGLSFRICLKAYGAAADRPDRSRSWCCGQRQKPAPPKQSMQVRRRPHRRSPALR